MAALFVDDVVFDEGDGIVSILVRLTEAATQAVSVNYATANVTAFGNVTDYVAVSGTLNFAIGETSKIVQVQLVNDAVVENLEHFRFNLSAPVNATIANASAMVSIVDNDTVVATPGIFVRDVVVDEKAGTASFVVMLGGPKGQASNSAVTVDYATANGTALAGSDYTAVNGTLTFAAGETVKTITVNITDDANAEGFERFGLNLSNASGATILDGHADAIIGESDALAAALPSISVTDMVASEADGYVDIVVSLSAPGQNSVAVNYTTTNVTAFGNVTDYVGVSGTLNFALGETTKVVRVELVNDTTAENLANFTFNLSTPVNATIAEASAMISIVDNDTVVATPGLFVRDVVVDEKAGTASFVVMLGGPKGQVSNSTVTVDYATGNSGSNTSATAGSDYTAVSGTLTFAAGETVKTVVVDITDDALAEGQERFNLNLSSAVGATILDGQGVALIGANDAAAVALPRLSVSDMVASEADGYVDIVVSLSAPGQNPVAVNYTTTNVTAFGNVTDYAGVSGTLNFALGETTKVVRVELVNDTTAENLENFTFNLSTPVNATIAEASAMVSIVDNDTVVDTPNLFVRDVVVDEKSGTASFVVMLGGPRGQVSNSTVTVDYATGNGAATAGSDYTAVSGTLTFASGETVKTVVVDITDDAVAEGQERFSLNLSNAIGATIADGHSVVVIEANDATAVATPLISVADIMVGESDGYLDIVVNLSAPGQNPVAVSYTTANVTAFGNVTDYVGVSGTLNFALGETTKVVRVELTDNAALEPLETFRFNLSSPVNATLANTFATISIVDNDTAGVNVYSYGISDDVYNVAASTDVIVENPGGGYDLVNASSNYILPDQVEALVLVEGAGPLTGTGNGLANYLRGNSQNNLLDGAGGDDTISGAAGNDSLLGGAGSDTLDYSDSPTRVIVNMSGSAITIGTDTVQAGTVLDGWGLAASNTDIISGMENVFGSSFNDFLMGGNAMNVLQGGDGNDTLDGDVGDDILDGGSGTDTAIYTSASSQYAFISHQGILRIADRVNGRDGVDQLISIEQAQFNGGGGTQVLTNVGSFISLEYIASFGDLIGAFGANSQAGYDHFINAGRFEGRQVTFNASEYIASYTDLMNVFGANEDAGASHYINAGRFEGRQASFNALEYIASYGDLSNAFGLNQDAGATHFIQSGRFEGRQVSFNASEYIASYVDLMNAFGANEDAGASHYINSGRFEGRQTSFNALEYIASYGDLIGAFGVNADAGATHYINAGRFEGRTEHFDPAQYLANYADLRAAFGTDQHAATVHYIITGYAEGRTDHA